MTDEPQLDWQWQPGGQADVLAVGDVQDVIRSRAGRSWPLPPDVTHGLGALSVAGPAGAGEGIVLRGQVGIAAPTASAGLQPIYRPPHSLVTSPFFLGWRGQPVATAAFSGPPTVTLHEFYRLLFSRLDSRPELVGRPVILVELAALLAISDIHDRALRRPVDHGDVLITDPEWAADYFSFHIVGRDTAARGYLPQHILSLYLVGLGFRRPAGQSPAVDRLEQAAFYAPPAATRPLDGPAANDGLRTHSHAAGWLAAPAGQPVTAAEVAAALPAQLAQPPDYVIHIDDWSRLQAGVAQIYAASPDDLHFPAAGGR